MKQVALFFIYFSLAHVATAQSPVWQGPGFPITQYGVINPFSGEPIGEFDYDHAVVVFLNDSLVKVKKDNRFGVISISGRTVVPIAFDEIADAQTGSEYGFLAVVKNGKRGVWDTRTGRQILPPEFEYARAIYPDLFVGRKEGSPVLEFFDINAQSIFNMPGQTAWPGFDTTCIEVIDADRTRTFLTKKGAPVFSEKFGAGRWTDGKTVIVLLSKISIEKVVYALVSVSGDTILPASTQYFQPLGEGRFIVRTTAGTRKAGLFDANTNQWLLPLSEDALYPSGEKGDPTGAILVAKSDPKSGRNLYDRSGKLLLENCNTSGFAYDFARARPGAPYRPFRYIHASKVDNPNIKGLFEANGRLILPMEFEQFSYYSERHAIIATRRHSNQTCDNAYDLKTGKKLFDTDFDQLLFTAEPARFWAQKEKKWGIVELNRPQSATFDYDQVEELYNGCAKVRKDKQWYLFDSNGLRVTDQGFDWVSQPYVEQFRAFYALHADKGKLLAVGRRETQLSGWYAVTDQKQSIFIEIQEKFALPVEAPQIDLPPMVEAAPAIDKSELVEIVERRPAFPGGDTALADFLDKNLQYPAAAKQNGIEGLVVVQFVVEKDGALSDLKILRDIGGGCGAEALRLVRLMPKWIPGEQDGQKVRAHHTLKVPFRSGGKGR